MQVNVTVPPSMTVFFEALVMSLAPLGLSKSVNQIKILMYVYIMAHTFPLVINHKPL